MKQSLLFTYMLLIVLTLVTALISNSNLFSSGLAFVIMAISSVKFLLVAFEFMELKKAAPFWKFSLSFVLGVLAVIIILIK